MLRGHLLACEGEILDVALPAGAGPGPLQHLMPAPDAAGPLLGLRAELLEVNAGVARLRVRPLLDVDAALLQALLEARSV